MSSLSPLVAIVKDLQQSFKSYKAALKLSNEKNEILSRQLEFLKLAKIVMGLFKDQNNEKEVKTLKKQANDIIEAYKKLKNIYKDDPAITTEVLCDNFEEDKEVYNNIQEVEDKNREEMMKEVSKIHEDLTELSQIFVDFSNIVDDQGKDLNKILYYQEAAEVTTARVNNELQQASFWQSESRKKCCWILLIILICLGVLAGIIAGIFISNN